MPNVIVRRPRTEQPQGPVPLRKELYENLLGYFPNSGNDLPTHPLTFVGNAAYAETEFGRATKFDGNGDYTSAGDAFYSDELSIIVTVNAAQLTADPKGIIVKRSAANEIWLAATSTAISFYAWQAGGTQIILLSSSLVPVVGQTYTIGVDVPPGSGTAYMYINGALVATANKTGIILNDASMLQFGANSIGASARWWNGYIGPATFWSKRLPNTQELTASPWAILEDEEFPVWFSAATGVSGTIAATWEAFTSSIIGTTTIVGSMAQTLDSSVGNLQGTTTIVGTIAKTLENDIGNFVGNTGTSGTIAVTAQDDTASMVGQTTIVGSMAATTEDATSSMTGSTTILGSMAQTIVDFVAALYGTSGTATIVAKLRAMIGVGQ